ncbi:glycosyltransferase [Algoriphagus sp.]|uniref:glycosyltransferase n=1 Tax=Algoriphagus sp. TaxID=1872435 RepID=UPI0025DE0013|nr:glycosyltransferase [Algoriphagus sp.]
MRILFLGETYRADAQTWIKGIEEVSGVAIETKEIPKSAGRVSRILLAIQFLISLLFSKQNYDLVLAERATSYGFFSLLVKTKIRVVAQQGITDAFPENGFSGWYKRILQRAIYTKADLIHAWGYVMTYAMLSSGASPTKILVKPKGLNLDKFTFSERVKPKVFTAIVTRSLYKIYRHNEILEAIQKLKKNGLILNCIIIGEGDQSEILKDYAQKLGITNQLNWVGRINNEELPKYLEKAEIYLAVPETEGVSASLFEGMAAGCFPIVTDLPANRAFINSGRNGLLVPVGNPTILAESIHLFCNNFSSFKEALLENRDLIQKECDLKSNMNFFYSRYQKLIKN